MMVPFRGGSSPLTRGKRHHGADCNHLRGLIPAHAGKTGHTGYVSNRVGAHPRSRGENGRAHRSTLAGGGSSPLTGENADRDGTVYSVEGSSPLTRGKRVDQGLDGSGRGLIPAHAGKTDPRSSSLQWARAHPRSRGENFHANSNALKRAGSSPLTRGKRRGGARRVRLAVAHPRSRGENRRHRRPTGVSGGSSPLTRGKLQQAARPARRRGLIPAHAGKTAMKPKCRSQSRAHPRSRGENGSWGNRRRAVRGSSPLTRGKPVDLHERERDLRLIPAHAGKTFPGPSGGFQVGAHPRSRGENSRVSSPSRDQAGSSPLTRGKRGPGRVRRDRQGLIPAHAGKTRAAGDGGRAPGAHPRSRGENPMRGDDLSVHLGSSPLTRGKRLHGEADPVANGLIPAHAGKTQRWFRRWRSPGAHPRSRGENAGVGASSTISAGSSPLTRGKHGGGRGLSRAVGLIPAHAGKTAVEPLPLGRGWAHPRSRGENSVIVVSFRCGQGSSPLTRGKHGGELGVGRGGGLIPAHAGKT